MTSLVDESTLKTNIGGCDVTLSASFPVTLRDSNTTFTDYGTIQSTPNATRSVMLWRKPSCRQIVGNMHDSRLPASGITARSPPRRLCSLSSPQMDANISLLLVFRTSFYLHHSNDMGHSQRKSLNSPHSPIPEVLDYRSEICLVRRLWHVLLLISHRNKSLRRCCQKSQ